MDDRRVGLVIRALRRRRGWRQVDLAMASDVSQSVIARAEAGHFDQLPLRTTRRILTALEARVDLHLRSRGGELDRLMDVRHAEICSSSAEIVARDGWDVLQEVTYSIFGERGSIDLLGMRRLEFIALIMEVKSEVTSWEEAQRRFDDKVRLLPRILHEREGWRPRTVGKVIVIDHTMTNRRRVAAAGVGTTLAFPARGREIRAWLRSFRPHRRTLVPLKSSSPGYKGRGTRFPPRASARRGVIPTPPTLVAHACDRVLSVSRAESAI
jgi:transcriptional regulator with XRE-family HTH domain